MKKVLVIAILLFTHVDVFSQTNLNNGLVAHYNFNKNTKNQVGNHSNGTNYGGVYADGMTGADSSSMMFDGVNDYVEVGIDSFLSKECTYSLWTKTLAFPKNGDCATMINVGGYGGDQGIQYCNNSSSTLPPYLLHGYYAGGSIKGGNTVSRAATGVTPDTSQWHHIVFMRFDKGMKLYVDCELIDSVYDNSEVDYGAKTSLRIGARNNNTTYYKGLIDEVRVYDRALCYEEVMELGRCNDTLITSVLSLNNQDDNVTVYPNPSFGSINVESINNTKISEIRVYSISGVLVYKNTTAAISTKIDIGNFSPGMYLVQIKVGNKLITNKINKM